MIEKHWLKKAAWVFLILFLMWLSFGAGVYFTGKNELLGKLAVKETVYLGKLLGKYQEVQPGRLSQDVDFKLFWEVWDTMKSSYVDQAELTDKKMFYGALRGMVESAEDPYTVFMDPKIATEFEADLAGTFEGIGAEIGKKNDILTIIAPLPEMPAEKAGLRPGDYIIAINEESTQEMSVDQAVSKIRGPRDTTVNLKIKRGEEEVKDYTITRGKIVVKSVRKEMRDDGVYVVKISNFNDDTLDGFNEAVRDIETKNPQGLILDLRSDPGGYLDTAIEVSSEWIEEGVVVTEKYSEEKKIEHLARGRARLTTYATVVLINQGSASASEIVAGALQDGGKAKVIGEKSFGKGSVQTLTNLDDGSSVKVTVAKWLTPKGRSINEEGIEPDIKVELTSEDYNAGRDPQIDAAVKWILEGEAAFPGGVYATSTAATSTGSVQ